MRIMKTTLIRSLLLLTLISGSFAAFHAVVPACRHSVATSLLFAKADSNSALTSSSSSRNGADSLLSSSSSMIQSYRQKLEETNEWHDSFSRNGLADFVPPASIFMQCLVVGGEDFPKLPFLWEPEDVVVSPILPGSTTEEGVSEPAFNKYMTNDALGDEIAKEDLEATIAKVVKAEHSFDQLQDDSLPHRPQRYDCILDQGLMNAILLDGADDGAVLDLCIKASLAIREHGIYVFVTWQLSAITKAQLEEIGASVGLEWQFDLDGISNEDLSVSAARKFCTDAMPSVGKLSM